MKILLLVCLQPSQDTEGFKWPCCTNRLHHTALELCKKWSWVMTSKRTRWARHVNHMVEKRNAYRILVEILKESVHLQDLGIGGKIIIKQTLKK